MQFYPYEEQKNLLDNYILFIKQNLNEPIKNFNRLIRFISFIRKNFIDYTIKSYVH
jgi:hypothetical protein